MYIGVEGQQLLTQHLLPSFSKPSIKVGGRCHHKCYFSTYATTSHQLLCLILGLREEYVGEHYLETQPILSLPDINQTDDEVSGCEIRTVSLDSSSNDETENLENNVSLVIEDTPQCRICLDAGDESLIAPCYCKGTQKYVHRSCLDNWRSTKEGFAFSHCTECRALFPLRANVPPDRRWLRLKFQFLVARDHALIFVVVQLIVALLGVLVYKFYGMELREMFGYEEHPYAFYIMAGE
ncbi:unnamed protein product [Rhodiola kirilowii]